ncbi:MAG: thioredoxin family protein [cyanobacterium endosymbiont of Rhopalodia musculus]|uniref:thioredoxin family protein n=1 Tax=cyanobacterium endosymbiont of Epithemia clementina EcSB TaxID=3034674 RepID=UPI00247FEFC5|nr:thioredoxin family protein [cyanobacterium endosymbiont of Epithemia clementina EcSB]WGT66950.1 thioredoxin family protein [cyanobacterium endosymbiont of Epithemia clementina EcSB]
MSEINNVGRVRNFLIAFVGIALSAAIFFGFQTQANYMSLEVQAEQSVPLTVAYNNGKPTLTEFYANWCTSCQAMASDLAEIKQKYADSVNFVMLNVDNNKWLPEILRYRVNGIPHFVFLNGEGEVTAQTIGKQPSSVMKANLDALLAHKTLPYAASTGQTSIFNVPVNTPSSGQSDARSHGPQVNQEVINLEINS